MNNKENTSNIQISEDVIAVISATAALEIEEVSGLTMQNISKKNISKGVVVSTMDEGVVVDIEVSLKSGTKMHEVSKHVQEKVKTVIESMTSLTVCEVNVRVVAVIEG